MLLLTGMRQYFPCLRYLPAALVGKVTLPDTGEIGYRVAFSSLLYLSGGGGEDTTCSTWLAKHGGRQPFISTRQADNHEHCVTCCCVVDYCAFSVWFFLNMPVFGVLHIGGVCVGRRR